MFKRLDSIANEKKPEYHGFAKELDKHLEYHKQVNLDHEETMDSHFNKQTTKSSKKLSMHKGKKLRKIQA
jgi:hypothetical protein